MNEVTVCRACGRGPAAKLVIRRHVGMLVIQKFVTLKGHFCRDCGTAIVKDYTVQTSVMGWWGVISFFFNWVCLAGNAFAYRKASSLPAPELVELPTERQAA